MRRPQEATPSPWSMRTIDLDVSAIVSYASPETQAEAKSCLDLKLVPFRSSAELPSAFQTTSRNRSFYLRFYLPRAARSAVTDLVIMVNNLGEAGSQLYDDIGLELAKRGVASVLYPLPNHFHRREDYVAKEDDPFCARDADESRLSTQTIISELVDQPARFIFAYAQAMYDASALLFALRSPRTNPHVFELCRKHLVSTPRVHVFGYSFGGLLVLALKLLYSSVDTCFLLASGANLAQTNAGVMLERDARLVRLLWQKRLVPALRAGKTLEDLRHLLVVQHDGEPSKRLYERLRASLGRGVPVENVDLALLQDECDAREAATRHLPSVQSGLFERSREEGERVWQCFVADLAADFPQARSEMAVTAEAAAVFEMVMLGDHRVMYRDMLRQNSSKILIVLGGSDTVFQLDAITSFSPRDTGLAILQIPGLGHWLRFADRQTWNEWKQVVITTFLAFTDMPKGNGDTT